MPTFAEALYNMPTEQLRAISLRREVDQNRLATAGDKRQLVQFLASELSKPPSITRAVLRCNARELRLLQMIVSLDERQAIPWRAIVDAAGGAELDEPLGTALNGLVDLGLVQRVDDQVIIQDSARHQVPVTLADRYKVATCLNNYDAGTLNQMAARLGAIGGTKSDNVEAIARHLLFASEGLFGNISLDREEQAVLDYMIQSGGAASAIEVASAVLHNTDDFFRYDWQNRWKMGKERNAIDRLLARGMIYVISYAYGFNLFLVIPGDLLRSLTGESRTAYWTGPVPEPAPLKGASKETAKHTALIRDMVALFAFISTQEAARTNTGYIHKTSLRNLAKALSIQNERYAAFLYAVARESGMIAPQTDKHLYAVTRTGHDWLTLSPLEQIRQLYLAWRQGDFWGEMYTDPMRRANEYRDRDSVVSVRSAALTLVQGQCGEQFIDLGSLTDVLGFRNPMLLAQSSSLGGDLVASPANFLRLLVGECLYWLGLVELCWSTTAGTVANKAPAQPEGRARRTFDRQDESGSSRSPDGYRLTPEGAHMLEVAGAGPPEEPPTETQFILQPNSEVFLPPYLDAKTLFNLLMIAETPGKTTSTSVVSLTRDSIRRALDLGISARQVSDFLRVSARMGIPQNVEYLIKEIGDKHGHIHIGRAQMYLHVDSPMILQELQSRRELKGYFVRTLGDNVAILNAPEPDKLLKELRKAGYLPISDDNPRGQGFIEVAGRAAPESPLPRSSPSQSGAQKDAAAKVKIDWDRIAQDDGRSWRETRLPDKPTSRPDDAVRDKGNIRFLLLDAIRSTTRVQLAYQGQTDSAAQIRIIEPLRVMGNFVIAHLPLEAEEVTLNINRVVWARATSDVFAPP